MSKFETTFKAAIAENERRILIDSLRSSPDLTIGEIHRLSKGGLGKLFNEITIADLMGGEGSQSSGGGAASGRGGKRGGGRRAGGAESGAAAQGGGQGGGQGGQGRRGRPRADAPAAEASAPAAAAEGKQGKQRRGGKAKAVNTRTAEGRTAYDEALFQAVKESGGPAGAGALIARAGGSSLQARAGLARLIEAGRITWSGKARGTKYSVA
jgi:hypothetical protein